MTTELLDLTELAARADVPAERLRHYAEVGLLPPARRDGGRLGYPPAEAHTMRLLAGVEDLGISGGDHTGLRLEVRMPAEATEMLAAVLGQPDSAA